MDSGFRPAEPLLWASGGALVFALLLLLGLLILLMGRGFGYFWPSPLYVLENTAGAEGSYLGRVLDEELGQGGLNRRELLYRGSDTVFAVPLVWLDTASTVKRVRPEGALVVDRVSEGPVFGFLDALYDGENWVDLTDRSPTQQATRVRAQAESVETLLGPAPSLQDQPLLRLRLVSGQITEVDVEAFAEVYAPNAMSPPEKLAQFMRNVGRFLSESPRRSNVQGGVFPAIVGTVTLVMLMALIVSPLGVLAAIYLQEYAHRGPVTRLVRIAVNNLAGVPSIVYGVFGLGFFVYVIGGSIDELLFAERLPSPTLGTPGMLWAALTMALLTLPVVVVATEEGLARVPSSQREGSLALGATRAETLWRVVLPAATPAVLTGLILAVARATGEVAPLILVGVAKYAPGLPITGEFPYLHLDRQFMHLGFYIYDLGFQSPQLETAEGLVFATALLLVLIVVGLNLTAVLLRARLRETFKPEEQE
ncbi:MAG: phosphate ABC transporter permease PstA [Congregibacter sp.]